MRSIHRGSDFENVSRSSRLSQETLTATLVTQSVGLDPGIPVDAIAAWWTKWHTKSQGAKQMGTFNLTQSAQQWMSCNFLNVQSLKEVATKINPYQSALKMCHMYWCMNTESHFRRGLEIRPFIWVTWQEFLSFSNSTSIQWLSCSALKGDPASLTQNVAVQWMGTNQMRTW